MSILLRFLQVYDPHDIPANILSPSASATVSIRVSTSFPELKTRVLSLLAKYPDISYKIIAEYPPPQLHSDVPGFDTVNVGFGTDIPFLRGHDGGDVKKFLYGPGSIFMAHTSDEHVTITDLVESREGYRRLVLHCLGM